MGATDIGGATLVVDYTERVNTVIEYDTFAEVVILGNGVLMARES